LLEWVRFNKGTLLQHELYATGTTGKVLEKELGSKITVFESGPLGGDQQIGARIAEGCIDFLIFFYGALGMFANVCKKRGQWIYPCMVFMILCASAISMFACSLVSFLFL
jgi:methylglyoxal synthase